MVSLNLTLMSSPPKKSSSRVELPAREDLRSMGDITLSCIMSLTRLKVRADETHVPAIEARGAKMPSSFPEKVISEFLGVRKCTWRV